ncbi:hypothetical protein Agub_g997 [Astrephomene gubernaculifera]|uniref:Uncharacterized protein n=1 Tax=Astrephomene gubernaculifera TaxID=47775 RepID=A0AAD3DF25_9CHLO|nr:hypothetical protein Agub_g997 [Astrephomene gubernaculifera]
MAGALQRPNGFVACAIDWPSASRHRSGCCRQHPFHQPGLSAGPRGKRSKDHSAIPIASSSSFLWWCGSGARELKALMVPDPGKAPLPSWDDSAEPARPSAPAAAAATVTASAAALAPTADAAYADLAANVASEAVQGSAGGAVSHANYASAGSVLSSVLSSLEDADVRRSSLGSGSSVDGESEGEMCVLVSDPAGDVQMVCASDPSHPVSLAERAVVSPLLPASLLRDVEARLGADLATLGLTVLFAVGFISLEFGINDLIEIYWGDSTLADVVCVAAGLALVFWVRLSRVRIMRLDRWR